MYFIVCRLSDRRPELWLTLVQVSICLRLLCRSQTRCLSDNCFPFSNLVNCSLFFAVVRIDIQIFVYTWLRLFWTWLFFMLWSSLVTICFLRLLHILLVFNVWPRIIIIIFFDGMFTYSSNNVVIHIFLLILGRSNRVLVILINYGSISVIHFSFTYFVNGAPNWSFMRHKCWTVIEIFLRIELLEKCTPC